MGYRRQFELRWQIAMEQQQRQAQFPELRPPPVMPPPLPASRIAGSVEPPVAVDPNVKASAAAAAAAAARDLLGHRRSDRTPIGEGGAAAPAESPMKGWSVEEVCSWAAALRLPGEVVEALRGEAVSGLVLPTLTEADLLQMGVTKLGHRRQLALAVQEELGRGTKAGSPACGMCVSNRVDRPSGQLLSAKGASGASAQDAAPKASPRTQVMTPEVSAGGPKGPGAASAASTFRAVVALRKSKSILGRPSVDGSGPAGEPEAAEAEAEEEEPAPPPKAAVDEDMESMIYALCDPFEVEQTSNERKSAARISLSGGGGESKPPPPPEEDDEALMYALLDPNEMSQSLSTSGSRSFKRTVTFEGGEEEGMAPERSRQDSGEEAEYWQDVTAIKASQRRKSKIKLELCSRRGLVHNGVDVDEPPEVAQARARQEEEEQRERMERLKAKQEGDEAKADELESEPEAAEEEEGSSSEGEAPTGPFRRTGKSIVADPDAMIKVKSIPGRQNTADRDK